MGLTGRRRNVKKPPVRVAVELSLRIVVVVGRQLTAMFGKTATHCYKYPVPRDKRHSEFESVAIVPMARIRLTNMGQMVLSLA